MDRYVGADSAMGTAGMTMTMLDGRSGVMQRTGLVVDVDYQRARSVLIGRTEGQSRFIAGASVSSTAMPPIADASVGAKQAIRSVEESLGLQIMGPDGVELPSRGHHGVDLFAITGQPVSPIRLSVVSAGASATVTPLIAAARRTITIVDQVADRVRSSDGAFTGALLEGAVREFRPDAVLLLQGDTADSDWTTAIGTLVGLVNDNVVNLIIIVAADQFQQQAARILGDRADLRGIDPAEFSVADIASALEAELQSLYDARVDAQAIVPAFEQPGFVSRVRAGELVTRFLARRREQAVVAVDVADGLVVHWATGEIGDVIVRPDMDLFRNIRSMLGTSQGAIANWLPMSLSSEELAHWILNRALRPHGVAETTSDIAIERAILVEMLRDAWASLGGAEKPVDLIVAGRPFSGMHTPALAALTLLDVFQPAPESGIVDIILDVDGLAPAAGAIGQANPAMAADIVENDLAVPAATALIVAGAGTEGQLAVRGQLRTESGETTRFTVPFGSVHRVRIDPSTTAHLSLTCEESYSIGGQQQLSDLTVGREGMIRIGEAGLIIDARGRPIHPTTDPSLRATRVKTWLDDIGFIL